MPFNNPPWHPIKDPIQLKTLGKLVEELGECSSAVARCIIQGVDEVEPVTGKPNREWLLEEIADVLANIELVVDLYKLDARTIAGRKVRKMINLEQWHKDA